MSDGSDVEVSGCAASAVGGSSAKRRAIRKKTPPVLQPMKHELMPLQCHLCETQLAKSQARIFKGISFCQPKCWNAVRARRRMKGVDLAIKLRTAHSKRVAIPGVLEKDPGVL